MQVRRYNWVTTFVAILMLLGWEAPKVAAGQVTGSSKPANKTAAPQKSSKKDQDTQDADNSAEADKVLYQKAMNDIKHARYDTARLSLETLINTYPDSEYLAKAKLAIADSYYDEGGATGLTQAVATYQDFITFFPFLEEASYAQMQIAMAHYRRMEKSDRDRSEALEAEAAFQTFIQKYPNTELTPKAEQRLREVQEVLADGDFRIASFYYLRRVDKAAAPRLIDLVNRYPLYSEADRANWMLGAIYERNEHNDMAATYYTRLVKEYPLSPLAAEAKTKLAKFGDPVPQPDPTAMARMQQEQRTPRERPNFLLRPTGLLKSGPDVSEAARVGMPTLTPQSDDATDTLTPGTGLTVVASGGASTGSTGGSGTYVQTVTPAGSGTGDPAVPPNAAAGNAASGAGASDPTASASAQAQASAGTQGQTAAAQETGQGASGPTQGQSSQLSGESSSNKKKKKSKKPRQVPAQQPQAQPQSQAQPQNQAEPQSQPQ
jgi:outer membrane protein assembly factor BamD